MTTTHGVRLLVATTAALITLTGCGAQAKPPKPKPVSVTRLCAEMSGQRPGLPYGGASEVDGSQPEWAVYADHLSRFAGHDESNQAWVRDVVDSARLMAKATPDNYLTAEAAVDEAQGDAKGGCKSVGYKNY